MRKAEVARLAGVAVGQIVEVTAQEVQKIYADRAAVSVVEVVTQEIGPHIHYWRVGSTCYLDDPEFGNVIAIDELDYNSDLGLHVRRSRSEK